MASPAPSPLLGALLLGRYDVLGRLRYVGRTQPLSAHQCRLLIGLLVPCGPREGRDADHPWPQPLPAGWTGQWDRPEPLPYTQVRPTVVAEVEVDTTFEHHRWRHQVRHRRLRLDLAVGDVPRLT